MMLPVALLLLASSTVTVDTIPLTCPVALDSLRTKVEADYAGFRLEITGPRFGEYTAEVARLSRQAETAAGDVGCLTVLRAYTDWFNDPHLAVIERDRHDSLETRRRMTEVERRPMREDSVLAELAARTGRPDPIEGIWYDAGMRLAIVRDTAPGAFLAVVTRSDTTTLPVGAVRGRFLALGAGRYAATLWSRDLTRTHITATVDRRDLLRLFPGIWGKVAPLAPPDSGFLDPVDAHRPTLRFRNGVPIFTIPSCDYTLRKVLDSLVGQARDTLKHSRAIVVDLRGNEGGSSVMVAPLLPYLTGADLVPDPHPFSGAVMLSSPDQIAYARRAFGSESDPMVRAFVAALRAAPGGFVPLFADPATAPRDPKIEPILGPGRAAILVDRMTVSAAEVLAAMARRTDRAVLIGEPTAGALDYQSTSLVRIAATEGRWLLIYPTITSHSDLPNDGMRGKGILPEIARAWDTIPDPIGSAVAALTSGR